MNASVKLLESVVPATVALHVQARHDHPAAQILGEERRASGTIIDPSGLILTVNYAVLGAELITVSVLGSDARPGRVVALDLLSGLAVVAVEGSDLPSLPLEASTSSEVGQEVFLVAVADDGDHRVSTGGITSLAPYEAYWEYSIDRAILSSAPNPGLGGGPVIDRLGRLIGVVALDLNEVGKFTMAVPVDDFLTHKHELLCHGRRISQARRAWIGVYCYTLQEHVVIAGVLPGSPGESAGLKSGDVVLAVDGQPVCERRELYARLWDRSPGDAVELRLFRGSEVKQLVVPAGDAEEFFS